MITFIHGHNYLLTDDDADALTEASWDLPITEVVSLRDGKFNKQLHLWTTRRRKEHSVYTGTDPKYLAERCDVFIVFPCGSFGDAVVAAATELNKDVWDWRHLKRNVPTK